MEESKRQFDRRLNRRSRSRGVLPRSYFFAFALIVLFSGDGCFPSRIVWGTEAFVPRATSARVALPCADKNHNHRNPTELGLLAEATEPIVSLVKTVTSSYGVALVENPLPTKSLTAGVLCGISDVIAQKRNPDLEEYNPKRTLRFASKGCLGGILWMYWYDWIDNFLAYAPIEAASAAPLDEANVIDASSLDTTALATTSSKISFYVLTGAILPPEVQLAFTAFAKTHLSAVTTLTSMVLEQFFWCPLVYGTFEIPISTLMNGGKLESVPSQVESKLNGLLVANAKVWTLANLLIYNVPLEWRLFLGNCIDIFWQSLVSDVSADCVDQEECVLPGEDQTATVLQARKSKDNNEDEEDDNDARPTRRAVLATATTAGLSLAAGILSTPLPASAGIDVSGLRVEGGGGNTVLKEQLKAIDGSGSARVNQIKEISAASEASSGPKLANGIPVKIEEEVDPSIATWLYRSNPAMSPRLSRSGTFKNLFRCDDTMMAPSNSGAVGITFEFPSDWLQLDKFLGGISYVDQRNGDRLYVLKTKLPEGERLSTIPKTFFGTSIFDPKGTFVRSQGVEVDEYKVSSAQTVNECPDNLCATHKRFKIKYTTVTGNGLRVERRALVDAYEMTQQGDVYMLMTSSNAVKFEQKDSPERQTVEAIVDSFRVNV